MMVSQVPSAYQQTDETSKRSCLGLDSKITTLVLGFPLFFISLTNEWLLRWVFNSIEIFLWILMQMFHVSVNKVGV